MRFAASIIQSPFPRGFFNMDRASNVTPTLLALRAIVGNRNRLSTIRRWRRPSQGLQLGRNINSPSRRVAFGLPLNEVRPFAIGLPPDMSLIKLTGGIIHDPA